MSQYSKTKFSRRGLITAAAGGSALLARAHLAQGEVSVPLHKLRTDAQRINIKSVTTFDVMVPPPKGTPASVFIDQPGRLNSTCVETVSGVRGYSFMGNNDQGSTEAEIKAAQVLVGQDLFAVEAHYKRGIFPWGAVEEAIWDAIGKIAGLPVCRLLGGASLTSVPVYVTCVWDGGKTQDHIAPVQQARESLIYKQAGFKGIKIRVWRKDYNTDAEAIAEIIAAWGPGTRAMVDRTARKYKLWTYEEALSAARAMGKAGCYWLEEPLAQDDYEGNARLRKEVKIPIAGGEGYHDMKPFRLCLEHGSYEYLQPELRFMGGVLNTRKVGVLAETFGLKIAPHGTHGLGWAGRLQCSAAMGAHILEIAVMTPPLLPDDYCRPFLPLLHGEQPFKYENGEALVPQWPGLGLNVDEDAVRHFRVEGLQYNPAVYNCYGICL